MPLAAVVEKLAVFLVLGSEVLTCSTSGIVKNSLLIIVSLSPELNSWTCRRMYLRKASEYHLPSNIIWYVGIPLRNNCMAVLDRSECVPTSDSSNPKFALPNVFTTVFICRNTSSAVMSELVL